MPRLMLIKLFLQYYQPWHCWSLHNLFKRIDFLTLTPIRNHVAACTLISASFLDKKNITVKNFINFYNKQKFIYTGVEFMQECYKLCFSIVPVSPHIHYMLIIWFRAIGCRNVILNGGRTALQSLWLPCTGNSTETCSSNNCIDLYQNNGTPSPLSLPVAMSSSSSASVLHSRLGAR